MPFRGNDKHTLDERGRVAIPARCRRDFNDKAVLTYNPEGCVTVHTEEGFQELSKTWAAHDPTTEIGRQSRRLFDALAFDAEVDRQGRILIPPQFRQDADLRGPVVIAGTRDYLEIWNPERWERQLQKLQPAASSTEQAPGG